MREPDIPTRMFNQEAEIESLRRQLKNGGGGGTSDGTMEPRIAKLEAHMEHVRSELGKIAPIPERLRAVEVRVDHLPSKGFIVTASATTIALLTAAIVFADKLRTLVG